MASLSLEHVTKVYPNGFEAVKDFNLNIEDKEFIIFVGPSGCGKSTTLRMIAGLEDISSGTLKIGDRVVNDVEPKDRDIAMVFQNYALYPHMTVYDNMAFGLKLRKVPKAEIDKMVRDAAKILEEESLVCQIADALDGTYWAGPSSDGSFAAISLENGELEFYELDTDGTESVGKYHWSLDTTGLTLYDDQYNALDTLSLTIDTAASQIQMTGKSGSSVLSEVSEDDAVDIMVFLHTLAEGGIDEADLDADLNEAE